jgi:cytidylate kinase
MLEQLTPSAAATGGGGIFLRTASSTETLPFQETMRDIIIAAATSGQVVIVGRGAQVLLADRLDVLHVRVIAPLELRVAYTARREELDTGIARRRVQAKDQARAQFMQTQYRSQHEDPHLYDLEINTAVIDLDSTVNLICHALEAKASRLGVPREQLGPGADLAPYPGKPTDFRVQGQSSS